MSRAVGIAVGLATLAIAAFLLRPAPPAPASPPPAPGQASSSAPSDPGPAEVRILVDRGEPGPLRDLATRWRHRARTDAVFIKELGRIVSDPSESPALRTLAAFVLGSLPDAEAQALLVKALAASQDPALSRTLILALGSTKDWDDEDDVFGMDDGPYVVRHPPFAIRIETVIEDAAVRAEILRHFRDEPGVRDAIALALYSSLRFADARAGFLGALPLEADSGVQGGIAKALAEWAGSEPAGSAEGRVVIGALVDAGRRPDADALRFRSEQGLGRAALGEAELHALKALLDSPDPDPRRWAMNVLAMQSARTDLPGRAELQASFERIFTGDADAKMREFAASALASFPDSPRAADLLVAGLSDSAWHVRAGAARALGRMNRRDDAVLSALRRCLESDADERVRAVAGGSLRQLGR